MAVDYDANSPELKAAATLLLAIDHKQVRWWDVEASLGGGKPSKNADKGKEGRTGRSQKASAKAEQAGVLPRPSVKRGEMALAAMVDAFEAKRAKHLTQEMRWTEKVVRQGA